MSKLDDILSRALENVAQSMNDEYVKENAEFRSKSGLTAKIVRKMRGETCDWCKSLEGEYIYGLEPKEVYQRHDHCDCTVEYVTEKGVQNVHTKKWKNEEEIEARKGIGRQKLEGEDVTARYYGTATPRKGTITADNGYKKNDHKEETATAELLISKFGGNMKLLREATEPGIKTPDFLWNDKYWELKTVTTEKAADSAIRKSLKQIGDNPGGIILDYRSQSIDYDKLMEIIDLRMKRSGGKTVDIMIILTNDNVKVLRYKK